MARRTGPTPDTNAEPGHASEVNLDGLGDEEVAPPFFNTTFSTHRLSPLYIGSKELTQTRLDKLAHRLRDALVGDVIRGIQIGLEATDTPSGQVGSLRAVRFRWFQASDLLGEGDSFEPPDNENNDQDPRSLLSAGQKRGLWVEMRHENAAYVALLLPGFSQSAATSKGPRWTMHPDNPKDIDSDQSQFLYLPLLLLRMPQALKTVVSDWLSTTFDCRVSKVALGTKTIVSIWEGWVETIGLPGNGANFTVTLAFNVPVSAIASEATADPKNEVENDVDVAELGLRVMEVAVSPQDLRRFLRAGKTSPTQNGNAEEAESWQNDSRERLRLAGGNVDDGWGWRTNKDSPKQPFTEALARYLNHHMALNMFHPSVRVIQISCGAFVLAQSRLKLVKSGELTGDLSRAAWMFVMHLGARVRGDGIPSIA